MLIKIDYVDFLVICSLVILMIMVDGCLSVVFVRLFWSSVELLELSVLLVVKMIIEFCVCIVMVSVVGDLVVVFIVIIFLCFLFWC